MRCLTPLVLVLQIFAAVISAQDVATTLPSCALECISSTPGAADPSRACTDTAVQNQFALCLMGKCTIKEILTTRNVTAIQCDYPHRDMSALCKVVIAPFMALVTMAISFRLTARLPRYGGKFGSDDYVILVAWLLAIAFTVLIWIISNTGLGKDIWTVPFINITLTLKYFSILTYIYITLTWLTKISILLLFLRLFPDQKFHTTVKVLLVLYSIAGFSFLWGCVLRCMPIDYAWNIWDGEHQGTCSPILISAQGWPHLFINIGADLIILFLPLPTLWKLKLALEKKLSVMAMFSVGLFVTAVSIFRATTFPNLISSTNFTWDWNEPGLWSAIEVYVGIICACMPGIRAFYTQVFPGRRRLAARKRSKGSRSGDTSSSSHPSLGSTATVGSGAGGRGRGSTPGKMGRDGHGDEFELLEEVDLEDEPGSSSRFSDSERTRV